MRPSSLGRMAFAAGPALCLHRQPSLGLTGPTEHQHRHSQRACSNCPLSAPPRHRLSSPCVARPPASAFRSAKSPAIGPSTYQAIIPYLKLSGASTLQDTPRADAEQAPGPTAGNSNLVSRSLIVTRPGEIQAPDRQNILPDHHPPDPHRSQPNRHRHVYLQDKQSQKQPPSPHPAGAWPPPASGEYE